jgi:multidrug efflux pump subunit AcrA (membrane-fusion protein)
MYCTVTVTAGVLKNVLLVPVASVMRDDNNQPFVYALSDQDQFARRDVILGETQDNQTQIVKGIAPGDRIVGNGSLFLQFANSIQH